MNSPSQLQLASRHVDEPAQQRYADALDRYLSERGYARNTARACVGYASHFLRWTQRSGLDLLRVDEVVVTRFLVDHLPHCNTCWTNICPPHVGAAHL